MKGKTIGRNQKLKAELIFKNATNIIAYTLDNGFIGKSCNRIGWDGTNWLWKEWRQLPFSKLIEIEPGKYELYIHSNYWAKFDSKIN